MQSDMHWHTAQTLRHQTLTQMVAFVRKERICFCSLVAAWCVTQRRTALCRMCTHTAETRTVKRIMKLEERGDEGGDFVERSNKERKEDYATKSEVVRTLKKFGESYWEQTVELLQLVCVCLSLYV